MSAPATVQEAKKQQQLDRLARKAKIVTDEDAIEYATWYGNQPYEVERAKKHAVHQGALKDLSAATEAREIAEITGEGLEDAKHNEAVAALVAERSVVPHRSAGAVSSLTSTGSK